MEYGRRVDMLRVFDAPAQIIAINVRRVPDAFIDIQCLAICPIADRMRVYLVAVFHRDLGRPLDFCDRLQHEAGRVGQVDIGFQ